MTRIEGIQCDWCKATADLEGDQSRPSDWSELIFRPYAPAEDLCADCSEAARVAVAKAKKQRQNPGKTYR